MLGTASHETRPFLELTRKLSHKFLRRLKAESPKNCPRSSAGQSPARILGALSKLDEFLLNQQIQTHSGTVPGTSRNTNMENQGTNEDDSQSDPHPEAGIFCGHTTQNSGPKDYRDSYVSFHIMYFIQKHVSYTCNSGELIQIGTEQLWNKRIFICFPYCIFILLLDAIFITNSTKY